MSANCLVTRLKDSVNNAWIPVLGCARMSPNAASSYFKMNIFNGDSTIPVKLYGDNAITASGTTYQNTTFNYPKGNECAFAGTESGGYAEVEIANAETAKLCLSGGYVSFDKSLEELAGYSAYLISKVFKTGNKFAGTNKLSTLFNAIRGNIQKQLQVDTLIVYRSNVLIDTASVANIGLLVGCTDIALADDYSWAGDAYAIAAEMKTNGRTSGSCRFQFSTGIKTAYFGSDMSGHNPTAEETAQGWCVR